jgi:hypothetical protein
MHPRHVHQAVLGSESPAIATLRSVETNQEDFLANLNGVQVLKLLFGHIQILQGLAIAVPKFDDVASDFAILDFFRHISLQNGTLLVKTMEVEFVVQLSLPGVRQLFSFGLPGDGVEIISPWTLC